MPKEGPCDPIAPLELPHSLHAFHRVSSTDELNMVIMLACFNDVSYLFFAGFGESYIDMRNYHGKA